MCAHSMSISETEHLVRVMPKVELHLHLEGAIPFDMLVALANEGAPESSTYSAEDLERRLRYSCPSDFFDAWGWKQDLLKRPETFEDVAYRVLHCLWQQNVRYAEVFCSPGEFRKQGLPPVLVISSVLAGIRRACRDFGIRCGLIVDLVRDHGPVAGTQLLDELSPFVGNGVIGIGLGGSEHLYPAAAYAEVFAQARGRGLQCSVHAGEFVGPESVWAAINSLGADRIGHGLRSHEDPNLVRFLRDNQIPLEICLTSNVKLGLCQAVAQHPFREYLAGGLKVTLNSDDPTMFGTSITNECLIALHAFGLGPGVMRNLSLSAVDSSFLPRSEKALLRREFEEEFARLGAG